MDYGSCTSSWKPWRFVRHDLILTMRDIYMNSKLNTHTKFTSSSKSTEFNNILPWNIYHMIRKFLPISTRILINYAMKWGIPMWIWWNVNRNWDNNMISISKRRERHHKTNTSIRRKKKNKKSRTVRIIVWDLSRKVNHMSKVIWKIIRVHQIYQFHQNRLASPYEGRESLQKQTH